MLLNYIIMGSLMTLDVLNGFVPPLHPAALPFCTAFWKLHVWWFNTSDLALAPAREDHEQPTPCKKRCRDHCTRALPWVLYTFVLLWPAFIVYTEARWGNDDYNDFPIPQRLSALFGAAVVVVTAPFWAVITLVHIGARVLHETTTLSSSTALTLGKYPA